MNAGHTVCCQHCAAESKRKSKNRVLPLDHLQRGSQVLQERHTSIVKEKTDHSARLWHCCARSFHVVLSSDDQLVLNAEHIGNGLGLCLGNLLVHLVANHAVE